MSHGDPVNKMPANSIKRIIRNPRKFVLFFSPIKHDLGWNGLKKKKNRYDNIRENDSFIDKILVFHTRVSIFLRRIHNVRISLVGSAIRSGQVVSRRPASKLNVARYTVRSFCARPVLVT